jgi:hypothetical protein
MGVPLQGLSIITVSARISEAEKSRYREPSCRVAGQSESRMVDTFTAFGPESSDSTAAERRCPAAL